MPYGTPGQGQQWPYTQNYQGPPGYYQPQYQIQPGYFPGQFQPPPEVGGRGHTTYGAPVANRPLPEVGGAGTPLRTASGGPPTTQGELIARPAGGWDGSVNPLRGQGGPHMDTFWQTYLTREGEQPQAYDAEARALQGQMERRHLSTVVLGTVIALPRGNLNDIWSYNDWYVSGWDLYRVHEFTRSGSTALDFIANIDNHTHPRKGTGYTFHRVHRGMCT